MLPILPEDSTWLFELHGVRSLPVVDLDRSLLSLCGLPKRVHDAIGRQVHVWHRELYALVRLALLTFTVLVFVRIESASATLVVWIFSVATLYLAAVPLLVLVMFSSLDVLRLLLRTYEYWFISSINTVHWACVADIVGTPRALLCAVAWLSIQSMAMLDANFRTFSAASKAALAAVPLLLALAVACALGLVSDARVTQLSTRGGFVVSTSSVVVFTSSTLALFMVKKVFATRHQLQERELAHARFRVVPCVVLSTRLALRPWRSGRRTAVIGSVHLRDRNNVRQILSALRQPLRGSHHWSTTFVADARHTLLPALQRAWLGTSTVEIISRVVAATGSVGFAASVAAWLLLVLTLPLELTRAKWIVGVLAISASHAYVLATFLLCQRDLHLALITNFDLMFTTFQCQALALTMMDMMQWRSHACFAVLAWWLWFNWFLLLDALAPPARRLLRFRRRFALVVIIWVLAVAVAVMVLTFADGAGDDSQRLLVDRRVLALQWDGVYALELHTKNFAVQRVATIMGWSTRLVLEFARSGQQHEELLFIRQPLEYSCPVLHSRSRRVSGIASSRRRSSPAYVGAAAVLPLGPGGGME